jgi:hypothetical protein
MQPADTQGTRHAEKSFRQLGHIVVGVHDGQARDADAE